MFLSLIPSMFVIKFNCSIRLFLMRVWSLFHYRSYGAFFLQQNRLHNSYGGFTHYRNYRALFWGSMSTVVDDEKLTSRENLIGFLFFCVQSDEDTLLKVDKVFKPNSNRLMFLINLLVASSFAL